jgi:hypothetical protein
MKSIRRILAAWKKKNAAWQDGEEKGLMLLDFQCVIPVPCCDISHFYCKRISASNNFAVLDTADKLDTCIWNETRAKRRITVTGSCVPYYTSQLFPY